MINIGKCKIPRKLKLVYGIFFSAVFLAWIPFLLRMRQVRMSLEHPESGLFLSRALVFIAMAACFILAVWGFVSQKIQLKNAIASAIFTMAAVALGAICIAFCVFVFRAVLAEYAVWPGGALF